MVAITPVAHTTFRQLYARRIPALAVWGSGLAFFLGWPHVVAGVSNKAHHVPPINTAYI